MHCVTCDGTGVVYKTLTGYGGEEAAYAFHCPECGGYGFIEDEQEDSNNE